MAGGNQQVNPAFPKAMHDIEGRLLSIRRNDPPPEGQQQPDVFGSAVGIGLSGGGIRSATFCLGLFQGLAKKFSRPEDRRPDRTSLLSRIDYMSTVSGGGYFGGFYGGLFTRDEIEAFPQIEDILKVRAARDEQRSNTAGHFHGRQQEEPFAPRQVRS